MSRLLRAACAAAAAAAAAPGGAAACRDAFLWPFNSSSIWNTPLGAGAAFAPAALFSPADARGPGARAFWDFHSDDDYPVLTRASDPLVPWYDQGHWGGPATAAAYCNVTGPLVRSVRFPARLVVQKWGNNNAAAIVQPDNRTALLMQPLYVCAPGAPLLALADARSPPVDIVADGGALGGHGGSGLSALGGAVRLGELLPGAPPIAHALKLELFANLWYYRPPDGDRAECYAWPAIGCDGYAFDCAGQPAGCYNGTNAHVRPGALLAVPAAAVAAVNATLTTPPARALLAALATYGGYLVDDTYWNATAVCTEHGVDAEFAAAWGYAFGVTAAATGPAAAWYADVLALFRALAVVTSNAPGAPGGGGEPLAPPPPPFCSGK